MCTSSLITITVLATVFASVLCVPYGYGESPQPMKPAPIENHHTNYGPSKPVINVPSSNYGSGHHETQHPIQPSSGYGSQPAFVHQQPIEHHKNEQNQHQSYGHQNSHVEFPKPQIPSIEHQHGNYGQEKPSSGHENAQHIVKPVQPSSGYGSKHPLLHQQNGPKKSEQNHHEPVGHGNLNGHHEHQKPHPPSVAHQNYGQGKSTHYAPSPNHESGHHAAPHIVKPERLTNGYGRHQPIEPHHPSSAHHEIPNNHHESYSHAHAHSVASASHHQPSIYGNAESAVHHPPSIYGNAESAVHHPTSDHKSQHHDAPIKFPDHHYDEHKSHHGHQEHHEIHHSTGGYGQHESSEHHNHQSGSGDHSTHHQTDFGSKPNNGYGHQGHEVKPSHGYEHEHTHGHGHGIHESKKYQGHGQEHGHEHGNKHVHFEANPSTGYGHSIQEPVGGGGGYGSGYGHKSKGY